jgi:hypothetical protein
MQKRGNLILVALILALFNQASAESNITLYNPLSNESCVKGPTVDFTFYLEAPASYCQLITNGSDLDSDMDTVYTLSSPTTNAYNYINFTFAFKGFKLWQIGCMMTTPDPDRMEYSTNYTFTLTDAPYCGVLSDTVCHDNVSINGEGVFKTRLSNTRGFYIENYPCNVWIENSRGEVVKKFNSMMYEQDVKIQLDSAGNWINTADVKVPLSDSAGWYVFPFIVDSSWAWYGDTYTVKAVCIGQQTSCSFKASQERLPDTNRYGDLLKTGGGLFVLLVVGLSAAYVFWRLIKNHVRMR